MTQEQFKQSGIVKVRDKRTLPLMVEYILRGGERPAHITPQRWEAMQGFATRVDALDCREPCY